MAKRKKKPKDSGLSGMLGQEVSVRKVRGKVRVRSYKPRRKSTSKLVAKVHSRFKQASQYSVAQNRIPEIHALYKTGITRQKHNPYLVGLSDFMNAPKVGDIHTMDYRGEIGDVIEIDARDDFMVTEVRVVITDAEGKLIEKGKARKVEGKVREWYYDATVSNPGWNGSLIKVVAYDRPGNMGTGELKVSPLHL